MSTTLGDNRIIKQAVDQAAKQYWDLLFSVYGQELCRDVTRRLKAEMLAHGKVASIDEANIPRISAAVKNGDGVIVEGVYSVDDDHRFIFRAMLDSNAEVTGLTTINVGASVENGLPRIARIK